MTGRLARLARLEATAALGAVAAGNVQDQSAAHDAAWQIMQSTMSPEQAGMVAQAYATEKHRR